VHACVPRHSLAVCPQVLIAAQRWLLSSTVCSSKSSAGAGAGATTARCMAACTELLAWTQLTQAQGTPARWRGPCNWWNEWLWDNGTTCAVQGPLRRTWYAASWPLASQHSLPPSHLILLLLPGMLLGDCANPWRFQCLLYAIVTLHRPAVCKAEVGIWHAFNIRTPSHSPCLAKSSLHTCQTTSLEDLPSSCWRGLQEWHCPGHGAASVPRISCGSSPLHMSANLFL